MTDIQRYRTNHISGDYYVDPDGELVTYADHVEAVKQAEQRGLERGLASKTVKKRRILPSASASMATPLADKVNEYRRGYEQGQQDALAIDDKWQSGYESGKAVGRDDALAAAELGRLRAYEDGCKVALAAAVQRVEALAFDHENGHGVLIIPTAMALAALRGLEVSE